MDCRERKLAPLRGMVSLDPSSALDGFLSLSDDNSRDVRFRDDS